MTDTLPKPSSTPEKPEISEFVDGQRKIVEDKLKEVRELVIRAIDFSLYKDVLDTLNRTMEEDAVIGRHCDFDTLLSYTTGEAVKFLLMTGRFEDAEAASAKFGADLNHFAKIAACECTKKGENLMAEEIANHFNLELPDDPETHNNPVIEISANIVESVKRSMESPSPHTYSDIKKEKSMESFMETLVEHVVVFHNYRSEGDFEEFVEEFVTFCYENNIDQQRMVKRLFAHLAAKGKYNLIETLLEAPFDFTRMSTNVSMCILRGHLTPDSVTKISEEVFDYLRDDFKFGKALLLSRKYGIRETEAEDMVNKAKNTGYGRRKGVRVSGGSILNDKVMVNPSEIAKGLAKEAEELTDSKNFCEAKTIADEFNLDDKTVNSIKSAAEKWVDERLRPIRSCTTGVDPRIMSTLTLNLSVAERILRTAKSLNITTLTDEEKEILLLRSVGVLMRAGCFNRVNELIKELGLKDDKIRFAAEVVLREGCGSKRDLIAGEYLK